MSLLATAPTTTSRPSPIDIQTRSPQLQPVVPIFSAAWLPYAVADLKALEQSGRNIPGVGDLSITEATADRVRRLISLTTLTPLPAPTLAPFSGGGVVLTWTVGNRELSFSAYPDQNDFVYMRTNDADEIAADGFFALEQERELSELILAFLTQ